MAYIYKWIEGERNLNEYCMKRFGEIPKFVETIGKVANAKVRLIYKEKEGDFTAMYLLYMHHPSGTVYHINDIETMTYEQIRTDRSALLK